jgi:hypothetical protein
MNLLRLEKEILTYFDSGVTPELIGPPGVGKSDTIKHVHKRMQEITGKPWGFSTFMIATSTPVHAMGYMVPSKTTIGEGANRREALRADYTLPGWMFTDDGHYLNDFPEGILFLDEWDKGDADTKKALAPLILSNRVGPHRLHKGIHVVVASNRQKDRSGSTKNFDFIINRRGAIEIDADFGAWEQWAFRDGLPPIMIVFAKKYAAKVFSGDVPRDQGPWCTPRSFVAGVKWLEARQRRLAQQGKEPPKYGLETDDGPIIQSALGGIMGEGVATDLCQWLRMRQDVPDFLDIVADPDGTAVPSRPDAKTLVAYECGYHITSGTASAVCKYMKKFDKDFQTTFGAYAARRNPMLITEPALEDFVAANATLINAL